MAVRAITEDNLGAWLIKCDPEAKFDLPAAIEDGMEYVTSWSDVPGYRADMMASNDKIILWVSGNGRRSRIQISSMSAGDNFRYLPATAHSLGQGSVALTR